MKKKESDPGPLWWRTSPRKGKKGLKKRKSEPGPLWWPTSPRKGKLTKIARADAKAPRGFSPHNEIETLPSGAVLRITPYWIKCTCPKGKPGVIVLEKFKLKNGNVVERCRCHCH